MTKIMRKLFELVGKNVTIITIHKWFGTEKFECEFDFINDNDRIGFKVLNKEIYLLKNEIVSAEQINKTCYIRDALMEIAIIHK